MVFRKNDADAARAAGRVGGASRMASLSHRERAKLAAKGGATRARNLSGAERRRIAFLAVAARERRRAEKKRKEQ